MLAKINQWHWASKVIYNKMNDFTDIKKDEFNMVFETYVTDSKVYKE